MKYAHQKFGETWASLLAMVVYGIVNARNRLSLDDRRLDTPQLQRKHSIKIIFQVSWEYRQFVKHKFIEIVEARDEDDEKFIRQIRNYKDSFLCGEAWGKIEFEDHVPENLILQPPHLSTRPKNWLYDSILHPPKFRGIGRHSLRSQRSGVSRLSSPMPSPPEFNFVST